MQAHLVHTLIGNGVACCHTIGWNVLVDKRTALNHHVAADVGELMYQCTAANDGPVCHLNLAGKLCRVGHDDVVAHNAVVCHMAIGHDQAVVAHNGLAA